MSIPHARIRLWTIQSQGAYQAFLREGFLRASHVHVDPSFTRAYDWMSGQLEKKTARPAGLTPRYPVWAWFQYDGLDCKKPKLHDEGLLRPKTRGVLLELHALPDRVLLSDFQKWHAVLNDEYLPEDSDDQREFDDWVASMDDAESNQCLVRARIEASWPRIFDLGARATDSWECPEQREIQAVLWHIDQTMVHSVEHFVASSPPSK